MTEPQSYRTSHSASGYGEYYRKTIERGYYLALCENIEVALLREYVGPLAGPGKTCLDFACGTGRIARSVAEIFEHVDGVDISASMLEAADVPPNVRLRLADLTVEPLDTRYDVITAFRFFLNAEDKLRRDALRAIHTHLNAGGHLVCNLHMNSTSPGGLVTSLLARMGSSNRNVLGEREFAELLTNSSFKVEKIVPYGYLPYVAGPWSHSGRSPIAAALVKPVEKLAKISRLPAALAQNLLVVARRA